MASAAHHLRRQGGAYRRYTAGGGTACRNPAMVTLHNTHAHDKRAYRKAGGLNGLRLPIL
jgi:hypothetical protein